MWLHSSDPTDCFIKRLSITKTKQKNLFFAYLYSDLFTFQLRNFEANSDSVKPTDPLQSPGPPTVKNSASISALRVSLFPRPP